MKTRTARETPAKTLIGFLACLSLASILAGCVTKSKAQAQARDAFAAGQQQAMTLSRMQQPQGPTVTVVGQVRNSVIPWTSDLTLARAIVTAGYFGASDPKQIYLVRNGKATTIDSKQLLNGEDLPVQPGDVIQIMQ